MKPARWMVLVGSLGWILGTSSCTRADLDAVTRIPPAGGGGGGAGGGGGGTGGATVTCPPVALPPGDTNQTVQVGVMSRTYVLHVPAAYGGQSPVPLIVDFHPMPSTGARERAASPYPPVTDAEGVVMAFPNGLPGPSGAAWNVGPCCVANVDDVAFTKAMVAQVQGTACIDPDRVYAVGFSMGGGMAHYIACHAADVFAAVAPAAFDLLEENAGDCSPARPITVIAFRGGADNFIPYAGGSSSLVPGMPVTFLGAQATFQKWAELDQCTDAPSTEDANGCSAHTACRGGVEVVLCTKAGGVQEAGNPAIAWPVLEAHPR